MFFIPEMMTDRLNLEVLLYLCVTASGLGFVSAYIVVKLVTLPNFMLIFIVCQ
ncbi:hypothetical protein SDC9_45355 [bioreactor metagenome]|uniref:Uncharacterized protein n=1 Tax=bioreactor metagenome TaxID=1076179 RepID=A0A644W5V0_9ZZZZ